MILLKKRNIIFLVIISVIVNISFLYFIFTSFNFDPVEDTNLVTFKTTDLITDSYSYIAKGLCEKRSSSSECFWYSMASGTNPLNKHCDSIS